jgi:hypothetical protein
MVQPIGIILAVVLATPGPAKCPADEALKKELGVEGAAWQMTCAAIKETELAMAALLPPLPAATGPRLVVAVRRGGSHPRVEVALGDLARSGIPSLSGMDWRLDVKPAGLAGADWLRVDVTAMSGEELLLAQSVTAFFRNDGSLQHVWTGASDRHERRFDACALDTTAQFTLSKNGELVRDSRTKRTVGEPGRGAGEAPPATKAKCVAPPPARDTFPVGNGGLTARRR